MCITIILSLFVEDKNQNKNKMETLAKIILTHEGFKATDKQIKKCIKMHLNSEMMMQTRVNKINNLKN